MPDFNPYAVSPAILKESRSGKLKPDFESFPNPLVGVCFSENLSVTKKAELQRKVLGLSADSSDLQLEREIKLHRHVDKFIEEMSSLVDMRHEFPRLFRVMPLMCEIKVPLEVLESRRQIEVPVHKLQLKSVMIDLSLFLFNAFNVVTFYNQGKSVLSAVFTGIALVQVLLFTNAFKMCFNLWNKSVNIPASLYDIENPSVQRLLKAIRSYGFYACYRHNHNSIRISLARKPQDQPLLRQIASVDEVQKKRGRAQLISK